MRFWPATVKNVACVLAVTSAWSIVNSGTFTVKSLDTVSAPLSRYLHIVADDGAGGLELVLVAGDCRVDLPDAGDRLVHELADFLETRTVGVDFQIRLPRIVERQRAARLHIDVATDDVEGADLAGRVLVGAVDIGAGDLEGADRRWLQRDLAIGLDAVWRHAVRQVGDRRVDVERTAHGALHLRLAGGYGRIEAGEAAGRLHVRRIACQRGVEVQRRNASAKD